jgi:hypothetical protein
MNKAWRFGLPVLAALLLLGLSAKARERTEAEAKAAETRLKQDLYYLADDKLEGRGPTTEGINKAADHIAGEFKKIGLKPVGQGGSYFQYFTIPGTRLMQPATLSFAGPKGQALTLKAGTDFHPMGLSHSGAVRDAAVVFAGYGVTVEKGYDDYDGLDVAGKVVVVLRDAPGFLDARARRKHAALVEKMTNAHKRDALAIVFVNDAETAKDGDDLMDFNFLAIARNPDAKLPAFHMKRAVVDKLLAAADQKNLATLEKAINDNQKPQSAVLKDWLASLEVKVKRDGIELKNVIGVLEGKGPKANETVVIGAHYDHLGYGGVSSLANLKKMAIHNGADDNASGTTAVLELARRFGEIKNREGRRLVFMTFSGEELGLLGSRHYCKNPIFPLDSTVAMVNLDMVGRLVNDQKTGQGKLQVWGTGTAKNFNALIDEINKKYNFALRKVPGGFGPSDHASFYEKKVPVYFFFTGDHSDYHRPTDDADKINYDGLRRVTDMVEELVDKLATAPERPVYVQVSGGGSGGPRPAIRLGIRPGYAEDKDGVLVEGVGDGEPAARAGMKAGDRIVEMGGKKIKNIEAYMVFMREQKKGTTIDVTVIRNDKPLTLKVKLE